MNRHECANKCFDDIMTLQGIDEFKAMVQRLRKFQHNKEKYSMSDVTLPNYLWIAQRGGGISTCIDVFAEYLYYERIIEFTGIDKYFECKLAYISPEAFFSELVRLNNTISEIAGRHRYFRGLVCINIDEWVEHTDESHFYQFLDYIASSNDKVLAILYVHTTNKRIVRKIESSLSSHIRFETVQLRFPKVNELVEFIETKYFIRHGFCLAADARMLLKDSILRMVQGEHFNGFITIKQMANDILFSLLESSIGSFEISAGMLLNFHKESTYVKRIMALGGSDRTIGFDLPMEDHSNEK